MRFREVTLASVGVTGTVPEGWAPAGDGRFNRNAFADDPTALYEEAFPQTDLDGVKAALSLVLGREVFAECTGTVYAAGHLWDLHTLEIQLPDAGSLTADFGLAQDGAWTYMVSLASMPDERDALYKGVFLPAIYAFVPLKEEFGLLNGGLPEDGQVSYLAEQLGYAPDSVLVIVHADDMAMHCDQTDGALEAMAVGMCRTGSVMVPCPDFERTLAIWKARPELDLGIHLTLNSEWGTRYGWGPVLAARQVPSLVNPDGILWPTEKELKEHIVVPEALAEMEAQILRVLEAGVQPTHMDCHMGSYWQHSDLKSGALRLARKYNLPMNPIHIEEMRQQGYVVADAVWQFTSNLLPEVADPSLRKRAYDDWMRRLKPGVHLLLTHIARVSDDYRSMIQGAYFRQGDYAYWASAEAAALAEELGITFIGYRELQELQATNWGLRKPADAQAR